MPFALEVRQHLVRLEDLHDRIAPSLLPYPGNQPARPARRTTIGGLDDDGPDEDDEDADD
jgi:hypothetical protein